MVLKVTFLLIPFVFCSCRFKDTNVHGQVKTYGTEKRIEHPPVDVMLVEKEYHSSSLLSGGYSYHIVEEQTMNSIGEFSFQNELDNSKEYFLAVNRQTIKPGYNYYKPSDQLYTQDEDYNQIGKIGGAQKTNLYIKARGWIKFNFTRNVTSQYLRYFVGYYNDVNFLNGSESATYILPAVGGHLHNVSYGINGPDSNLAKRIEVYVVPLDTVEVNLSF